MDSNVSIIITISVILFSSPYISKIVNIPTTPIEIILGMVAGYFGFIGYDHYFELVAEVGFFYLMFLAGMEVNLKVFETEDNSNIKMGFIYMFLLYLLSFIVVQLFDFSNIIVVMLPLISIGLIVPLYKEFDKEPKWLSLSMNVGVIGELISIVILTLTGAFLKYGLNKELYETLGLLALFLIAIIFVYRALKILFWWYPSIKTYLIPIYSDKDEKDIRLSMSLFFLMIAVMVILELEVAFGAFIAGTFITSFFAHNKELPHKLSNFGFGFLVPIFFVYIGSTFELKSLLEDGLVLKALLITFSMIFIRIGASLIFKKVLSVKEWIYFSLSHSMPLTLLIAITTLAHHNQSIDQFYYYAFILASIFEVIFVMISIKLMTKYWDLVFIDRD